jgi:hypothetical protein
MVTNWKVNRFNIAVFKDDGPRFRVISWGMGRISCVLTPESLFSFNKFPS